ncbi:superoxide dismutase, Ni [Marinomonas mediterranea]|jgi:superoxide dismutase, Ni|uniref:Superoxide dismutase, Ni n=1 Tax=Marinomonas mediterranea (strain ATCC 700492 / JCM 21426 / NBRC 103028 / MMB-1) TaxID=717774 RepID=F2K2Y4_MARM1|nr:superoxide dismutase, Ni [Marinomonas mediterranea]ADZ92373.1 superoxide dismutase, Ni [Marinomonas mediterranea MMB-1]WCN18422.1 superoxide dismutase, Ni [Marinomonas mediterranea MMB-1]
MIHSILKIVDKLKPFDRVKAHCDIPCKIYDPNGAIVAAMTCVRMMDLIEEIGAKETLSLSDHAQLARLVNEKEVACRTVKEEVRIIWGDYFKAPQFAKFPDASELVHSIMMQASKCKQSIAKSEAAELVEKVNQFADMFWQTKDVPTYRAIVPYPPALEAVFPDLKGS